MFDSYSDLKNNVPGAFEALKYCIKYKIAISGKVLEWLVSEHPELIVEEYYEDFSQATQWTIDKAYILNINGEYYRVWAWVRLTGNHDTDWPNQFPQLVKQKPFTVYRWLDEEEEETAYV